MCTDASRRIGQTGSVLYLHPNQRVGVVGAPYLRGEVQHTRIEPTSPRGAVFQQDVGEGGGDTGLQLVEAEDEAVGRFGLPYWGGHGHSAGGFVSDCATVQLTVTRQRGGDLCGGWQCILSLKKTTVRNH